jgi:L,D-transpeptidase ErfK/SrfK
VKKNALFFLLFISTNVFALTFNLPSDGDAVVGKTQWTQTRPGDNFSKLGRRYDVGYFELVEANPGIDPDHPKPGTIIVVPTKFIIPNVPRTGIVLNTAELRVYYFPQGTHSVITFPVGIGREGWDTPVGMTTIVRKAVNPTWTPTENIRKWHLETLGNTLPAKVLPGPDNPLGGYAMYLGIPTILMHGTNDPSGIGRRSSSGCIRIWPEDVEDLFSRVKVGTPVRVIDTPYKAGWLNGKVYLEAHVPLQEKSVAPMRYDIESVTAKRAADINWHTADRIVEQQNGIAQVVGEAR